MIGMSSSSRSFGSLGAYLVAGRSGTETDRVAWSVGRNLPADDPVLAARIMEATAAQNARVEKPVYHLALSFDPGDAVDRAAMERVADRVVERLGLGEYQVLVVAHQDREHPHVHLLVNRVHPETGRAWSRWRDQVLVQQVLREEERALGLRAVPGRLAPAPDPAAPERTAVDRTRDGGPEPARPAARAHTAPRGADRTPTAIGVPPWAPSVEAVARDLRAYAHRAELAGEQYQAGLTASAAQARAARLEVAASRAAQGADAFTRALDAVYRDPDAARRTIAEAAARHGAEVAMRGLREAPERYGALATTVERRAFGLVGAQSSAPARAAAGRAADLASEAAVAQHELHVVTVDARARRLEEAFRAALGAVYHDPDRARAAFARRADERGPAHAAVEMRTAPETFGPLRSTADRVVASTDVTRARAAAAGVEAFQARAAVAASRGPDRATAGADTRAAMRTDTGVVIDVGAERTAARLHVHEAAGRERALRQELRPLPGHAELEHRVARAVRALTPREFEQLRLAVTAPQLLVAQRMRAAVRDAVLDRDAAPAR